MESTWRAEAPDPAWLDQAGPVREGEALDAPALAAYLREHLPEAGGPLQVEQFPSGYSNLTYLLRLGGQELVLRRPPFGANIRGGHDMAREYRLLSALYPTYRKVPQPLLYCPDERVLGAPFYVMQRVQGVILRRRAPPGLRLAPERMRQLCYALADTLVDLHRLDYAAIGLGDLGRPEGYVERQITGWAGRYARAQTDPIAEMEQVAAWLAAHRPPDSPPALIHNDFRCDNVLLDPADLACPRAVLDWEMATIGDPLMDLGTTLAYWAEPEDAESLQAFSLADRPGAISRQEFAERYARHSGRDLSQIVFYYVYGLFKLAVIVQQIYARYRQGLTQDERFMHLIDAVRACARAAARAAASGRMDRLGS